MSRGVIETPSDLFYTLAVAYLCDKRPRIGLVKGSEKTRLSATRLAKFAVNELGREGVSDILRSIGYVDSGDTQAKLLFILRASSLVAQARYPEISYLRMIGRREELIELFCEEAHKRLGDEG